MGNNSPLLVVSNNPLVWERFPGSVRVEGTVRDLLFHVQGCLAEWEAVLYAHPAAGNLRLLRNPFRSVILENRSGNPDGDRSVRDMRIVEELLLRLENMEKPSVLEGDLADYRIVDLDLLLSALPRE